MFIRRYLLDRGKNIKRLNEKLRGFKPHLYNNKLTILGKDVIETLEILSAVKTSLINNVIIDIEKINTISNVTTMRDWYNDDGYYLEDTDNLNNVIEVTEWLLQWSKEHEFLLDDKTIRRNHRKISKIIHILEITIMDIDTVLSLHSTKI